ncbi:MAG: sigma-70 family RNA polymerase sigma factor [Bacteroidota bacterium]
MEPSKSICEEKVFQKIYYEHINHLKAFLYYKSGNREFAEDGAQEAFLKLWKNCSSVDVAKVKNFLFTTAKNLFLDDVKHQKVILKYRQKLPTSRTEITPQYLLEEKEFKERLERAINTLPETQRIVFLMNRIDKLKYREIADKLGISQKAVEKRMHKALLELKKLSKNL